MGGREAYFTLFDSGDGIIDQFVVTTNADFFPNGSYVVSDSGYYLFSHKYFPVMPITLKSIALFVEKSAPFYEFVLADDGENSLIASFLDDTIRWEDGHTTISFELSPNDSLELLYFLNRVFSVIYKESGLGL